MTREQKPERFAPGEMKEKDLFFLKADKGNSMVVVDENKCDEDLKIVSSKEFEVVKSVNPLTKMII